MKGLFLFVFVWLVGHITRLQYFHIHRCCRWRRLCRRCIDRAHTHTSRAHHQFPPKCPAGWEAHTISIRQHRESERKRAMAVPITRMGRRGRDCRMSWMWRWARLIRRLVFWCIEQAHKTRTTRRQNVKQQLTTITHQQQSQYIGPASATQVRPTSRSPLADAAAAAAEPTKSQCLSQSQSQSIHPTKQHALANILIHIATHCVWCADEGQWGERGEF